MNAPDFSKRIPQLDGLRGVAIAMVVAFHYGGYAITGVSALLRPLLEPTQMGWSGVDLFFVLSGFLIGGILLDARGSANYFGTFYRRRICRIFPFYFIFLVFVALVHAHGDRAVWSAPWWTCVVFCQNFWMATHGLGKLGAVNITWSLAIEEQFYLLLPAVIYFVKPSRLPWVLGGGIVAAPLVRLVIYLTNPRLTGAMFALLPCRMDSLLLGVATAYFLRWPNAWDFVLSRRRQLWTAIEILTALCALLLFHDPSNMSPLMMLIGFDCLAVLYSLVLIATLVDQAFAKILRTKWLIGLGGIAYSVYLLHVLIFGRVFAVTSHYPHVVITTEVVALAVTIAIAKLSWKYFEKPFILLGHRAHYSGHRGSKYAGTAAAVPAAAPVEAR